MSRNYDFLLNELIVAKTKQAKIAKDLNFTPSYVSQIKKRIKLLEYTPRIENDEVVCLLCGNNTHLVFHHDHSSTQQIAILCNSCNMKIGNMDLEGNELYDVKKYRKKPYRMCVDLKRKELYDFFINLSNEHYNGNQSRTIRALLKKVKKLAEQSN